jgi:ribose 5-phosphate isomerase RpiB
MLRHPPSQRDNDPAMTDIDPRLIEQITRQVLDALKQRAADAPAGGASSQQGPVDIHPPAGVCTGDYSKFTELKGKLPRTPAPTDASAPTDAPAVAPPSEPVALGGIVTAAQLQAAVEASADGVALLAADARLTPLASDYVRQHPEKVRRGSVASPAPGAETAAAASSWVWWIDGNCPTALDLARQHSARMRPLTAPRNPASTASVVREVAQLVRGRQVAGAILFVGKAVKANCFANRCTALRAVVAAEESTVQDAVTELGANVLIVEYPRVGPRAMAAMLSRMLQSAAKASAVTERELADLHRS